MTDAQWARMEPHCLGKPGDTGRAGKDNRRFLEAVLWIVRTGGPWRDLPSEFGSHNTVFLRFNDWSKAGVFQRMFAAVADDPDMDYAVLDATIVKVHRHGQGVDRAAFDLWGETQLAPTLRPGDVVVLDNLPVHKSEKAARLLKERGAWFLFLPPYSPDLNPIEIAFAKLKAHLRRTGARTFDDLWRAVGHICDLFSPQECWTYLAHAGYAAN